MSLMPVEEARHRVLETASGPLDSEVIPIEQGLGRVLASDISARITQPPFAASAMDGYAVRASDVAEVPVDLQIIGEAPAGRAFDGSVSPGQAVRIFTGAPVPEGADTIVIQEDTERLAGDTVRVNETSDPGRYVRPSGLDFSDGDVLITAGRRLIPREIALAAAMNVPEISVYRSPRVAILATGDELVLPGSTPRPDQIVSSNNFGLRALVAKFGGVAVDLGIARDDVESLRSAAIAKGRRTAISSLLWAVRRSAIMTWSRTPSAKWGLRSISGASPCGRASRSCSAAWVTSGCLVCPAIRSRPLSVPGCS